MKQIWQRIRNQLKMSQGEDIFTSWFEQLELEDIADGAVYLSLPTKFLKSWHEKNFHDTMLQSWQRELKDVARIEYAVRGPNAGPRATGTRVRAGDLMAPASTSAANSNIKPAPGGDGLDNGEDGLVGSDLEPRFTFSSFVVGPTNRLAQAAAMEVAETGRGQPLKFNPLYIYGGVGLGKTHLLNAIAWQIKKNDPACSVLYLTAEHFRYRFIATLHGSDKMRGALAFKEKLRGIDVLIIDDIEFLHGKATQLEFSHTLNALIDGGQQIVIAGDKAPGQLKGFDARLRSRLAGGMVAEIGQQDYELRKKILERLAADAIKRDPGFAVPESVIQLLARELSSSGRELEGAMTRLRATCQYTHEPITSDGAKQLVNDLLGANEQKRVRIDDIQKAVAKHYSIKQKELLSKRRSRDIVRPRQIGMYLAKQLTTRSLPEIGRRFGGRDHTTVIHAIRKVEDLMSKEHSIKEEIEFLRRMLGE